MQQNCLEISNYTMESTEEATALNEVIEDVDTDTVYVPDIGDDDPSTPEIEIRYKRKCNSEAWKYFTVVDPDTKLAKCKACGGIFRFTTTVSNLRKHTQRKHPELIAGEGEMPDRRVEQVLVRRKPYKRKMRAHKNWKYFDVTDAESKLAECKLCGSSLSFSCTSNLTKHINRMHEEAMVSSDEEGEEEISEEQSSPLWAYFKCLSKALKIASCHICKERLNYENYKDLRRHLSRKHPQVKLEKSKELIITDKGDIFEVADDVVKAEPDYQQDSADDVERNDSPFHNDEVDALEETAVEYLEENIFDNHNPEPAMKRRTSTKSSDKIITKSVILSTNHRQEEGEEDCLDIFGKYVVSLLRKLPKHKSDRLQAEIITKVMDAQIDDDANMNKNIVVK